MTQPLSTVERIKQFVEYASSLNGDEKGEAQVFLDRLFIAFGHQGYKEAGAVLEDRVKGLGTTKFVDLRWQDRVLIEMKKKKERLQKHYKQAFEYWLNLVPNRPKYVILCNFDEFWIYDFDYQLNEPVDKVAIQDLPDRFTALNFLFPIEKKPQFNNDRVAVTKTAARRVANVYKSLIARKEDPSVARRFVLQCVVALFSEDANLLPRGLFTELLDDCKAGENTYDLIGSLFRQMNTRAAARGGRFKDVPFFNGGVFEIIEPVELNHEELFFLRNAAEEKWNEIQPAIFGTLFEDSLSKEERHEYGAHFTSEADILRVIIPTIVRPLRNEIEAVTTLKEMKAIRERLLKYKVLDPACGSGNFLYVAFREIKQLELDLLAKLHSAYGERARSEVGSQSLVSPKQMFGLDKNKLAVELAKVTLTLGRELAIEQTRSWVDDSQTDLDLKLEEPLPLDNLDENIRCEDALFVNWPQADAIVGNPPFQSKNKMIKELGNEYVKSIRARYPDVSGRADYCVYWFRRAHDELRPGLRAGLVGTNTIRQNFSREGGLDYIVGHGGTITEAVSSQPWSGDAAVHVSIVNWIKGKQAGKKKLLSQVGDTKSPWSMVEVDEINSSLSQTIDLKKAQKLAVNIRSGACYQGQTHGHKGFVLSPSDAEILKRDNKALPAIFPYLIFNDLIKFGHPKRFVIDLNNCNNLTDAMNYGAAFKRVQSTVLPDILKKAEAEKKELKGENGPRQTHLQHWWKFWRGRPELIDHMQNKTRYIVCGQVTKRPIFEFISTKIRPNASLIAFPLIDDYSFGILQSKFHWLWFTSRCSTLTERYRYTIESVFDSFPWPQTCSLNNGKSIADAARTLRNLRNKLMQDDGYSLRDLYRSLEVPGLNPVRQAQESLDYEVEKAYGFSRNADPIGAMLELNLELASQIEKGKPVVGPGLPFSLSKNFLSNDCITVNN